MRWCAILLCLCGAAPTPDRPAPAPTAAQKEKAAHALDKSRALLDQALKDAPPAMEVQSAPSRSVEASIVFAATVPGAQSVRWTIYAPAPPEHDGQRSVSIQTQPEARPAVDLTPAKRAVLLWKLEGDARPVGVSVAYTMDLRRRRLVPRTAPPAATSPATPVLPQDQVRLYLQPNSLCDYEAHSFQEWLLENRLRPQAGEGEIDFARRVFLFIRDKAKFDFKPEMDRRGSAVCKTLTGDCGSLTALYVSILRASGVPSRQVVGRWAESAARADKLKGQQWQREHIKAEFFARGVGWVPVDLSVAVEFDPTPGSQRWFGRDDGDFVTLHFDVDLRLESFTQGIQTIRFLQETAFWVGGQGNFDGLRHESDWRVKAAGREPRPATGPAAPPRR